jgi:hypothetical protein
MWDSNKKDHLKFLRLDMVLVVCTTQTRCLSIRMDKQRGNLSQYMQVTNSIHHQSNYYKQDKKDKQEKVRLRNTVLPGANIDNCSGRHKEPPSGSWFLYTFRRSKYNLTGRLGLP